MQVTLLDLPVKPSNRDTAEGTNIVQEAYLKSVRSCENVADLKKHVKEWHNLWLLNSPTPAWHQDTLSTWVNNAKTNWTEVFRLVKLSPDEQNTALRGVAELSAEQLAATDILLPQPLLAAAQLAHHFGVGTDLGLVRLYLDPYPNLENEMRSEY